MSRMTNRRAEEFERALSSEGTTKDPTMAAMVALAGSLAALPQRPAPAFREALRTQLMAEAAQIAASAPAAGVGAAAGGGGGVAAGGGVAPSAGGLAKFLSKPAMQVATGGLAATIAATGVGVGASRSLPGDPLYGLKRMVENLQAGLAGGTIAEADAVLEHADTRVEELLALIDNDASVGQLEGVLAELKSEVDQATADLLAQARAGSREAYDKLLDTASELVATLSLVREQLPPGARDDVDATMATLNSTLAQLRAMPVPPLPGTTPTPTRTPAPSPTTSPSPSSTKTSTTPTSTTTPPSPTISVPTDLPPTGLPTVEPTLPTLPPLLP